MSELKIRSLSGGYPGLKREPSIVFRDVSVDLRPGELACLLGPNGAGKSTLMRTVAGMQKPFAGRVLIDGDNVHSLQPRELARLVSVVLTDRISIGMLTAYSLVALGRHPHTDWTGTLKDHDHDAIRAAIEAVGAEDLAARNINELSDGERQKIMVARALAQQTPLMILDEITAFLDLPRRVEIIRILRNLARTKGKSILLSTHDLDLALRSADRIWLLPRGGNFQAGSPEDLVLSGAFEAAFLSEGVDFDRMTGAFRLHRGYTDAVSLEGEGIHAVWTARALEREGLQIVASAPVRIKVSVGPPTIWTMDNRGIQREYESLDELVAAFREAPQTALPQKIGVSRGTGG